MEFVKAGVGDVSIGGELKDRAILGGVEFVERLAPALRGKSSHKEIPRAQRFASRPALEELLSPSGTIGKRERNHLLRKAHLEHGYSFTEIAKHSGLHYSTVGRIVKRLIKAESKYVNARPDHNRVTHPWKGTRTIEPIFQTLRFK